MARPVITAAAAGTAASRSLPGRPGGRRGELDVARALVVAGLVVFHSAMVFGTSWFVNVPRPNIGFGAFLHLIGHSPALMPFAIRHGLKRRAQMRFAMKLLGNLTETRGGDAADRIINALSKVTPAG